MKLTYPAIFYPSEDGGYTVSVPDLVKIELRGGVMKLTGLKKGRTTIIVSDGAAIRKPIEVTVE